MSSKNRSFTGKFLLLFLKSGPYYSLARSTIISTFLFTERTIFLDYLVPSGKCSGSLSYHQLPITTQGNRSKKRPTRFLKITDFYNTVQYHYNNRTVIVEQRKVNERDPTPRRDKQRSCNGGGEVQWRLLIAKMQFG